jgi:hypothetical protein
MQTVGLWEKKEEGLGLSDKICTDWNCGSSTTQRDYKRSIKYRMCGAALMKYAKVENVGIEYKGTGNVVIYHAELGTVRVKLRVTGTDEM